MSPSSATNEYGYCSVCGHLNNDTSVCNCANKQLLKLRPVPIRKLTIEEVVEHIDNQPDIRTYNVGTSNYAKHKIQPWDIWLEYNLNPWDADIIKRTLRTKEGDSRVLDYEKIIHICQERIRQLTTKEPQ